MYLTNFLKSVSVMILCGLLVIFVSAVRGEALDALEAILPAPLLGNLGDLVRAASTACEVLPDEVFLRHEVRAESPMEVVEWTRSSRRVMRGVEAARRAARRGDATVVVYVPGWWNTPSDEAAQALASALLKRHSAVLVSDTRRHFRRGYLSAASAVTTVGALLFNLIESLAKAGVPPSSVHLIGFSLGAHAAGAAGRLVNERMRHKVGRVTALDPAGPCFTRGARRVSRADAEFVHVVHSSELGQTVPTGHADVYVASGQPACRHRSVRLECDHNQSWRMFAASVATPRSLAARRCHGAAAAPEAACDGELAPLGYGTSSSLRGIFSYTSQ